MKTRIIFISTVVCIVLTACHRQAMSVSSPDGQLTVHFALTDAGMPTYQVCQNDQTVLDYSALGLCAVTAQGDTIDNTNWQCEGTEISSKDETWQTVWGEEQTIRDHHNQLLIHLRHDTLRMDIVFRAFNDGFALRYAFPEQPCNDLTIIDEYTSYTFAEEPQLWSIPWRTEYYEALFQKAPLHEKDTMNSPVTIEMADGSFAFLHEAALTDFPCQNLYARQDASLGTYLTPWMRNDSVLQDKAYIQTPFATPWRFMILTDNLRDMVASRIMLNLNEPCRNEDTSWIRPMKFIGIWWGMHMRQWTWRQGPAHGATTEHMRQYLDFAHANNIQGVLAEGWNLGWEGYEGINNDRFSFVTPYPDYDLEWLSRYADSLGVQIICHHETSGRANEYEADLDTAYQYMQAHGMHAVKTGYVAPIITTMDGHQINRSQSGVRHYRKVIETAARYQVMIDNHEPAMPTGLQRTYPNLMTQEGIRGQEWNAWAQDGGSPCSHVCTLPFTRMMAGPADYTPGVFAFENSAVPGTRVHSTLANQLALFVVLYSPLQMACDRIENYMAHPAEFQFIRDVPCDWQQSHLLDGAIGEFVIMARQDRRSPDWYVGAITNDTPRNITIDWSFLDNGEYQAIIYRDGDDAEWVTNPYSTAIDTLTVSAQAQPMPLHLASGGGCAIRLIKQEKQ